MSELTAPTQTDLSAHYTVVQDDERADFFPNKLGAIHFYFEQYVFAIADKTIADYNGGYWEFAQTASGTPFVFLRAQSPITMTTLFGGDRHAVPVEVAGAITTTLALEACLSRVRSDEQHDQLVMMIDDLKDTARTMADEAGFAEAYFRLTD